MRHRTLYLYLLSGLVASLPVVAQPKSPLGWVDSGSVSLGSEGASVQVLNYSSQVVETQLQLVWNEEGSAKEPSVTLTPNAPVPIEPRGVFKFELKPVDAAKGCQGVVLAYAKGSEDPIRRDVSCASQPTTESTAGARFLLSEMSLRKYLYLDCLPPYPLNSVHLPLVPGSELKEKKEVHLANENGETATLTVEPGTDSLTMTLEGATEVGTYKGKLQPESSDASTTEEGSESVDFSVTSAHHPLLAIAAITIALLVALAVQRYVGVLRTIWGFQQRVAELGVAFKEAQERFEAVSAGRSFGQYSVEKDFALQKEAIRDRAGQLRRSAFSALDEATPVYKYIVDELASLEVSVELWKTFAEKLSALDIALGEISWDLLPLPPDAQRKRPVIYEESYSLLVGSPILLADLPARYEKAATEPASVRLWERLDQRAAELHRKIQDLLVQAKSGGDDPDKAEARERLDSAQENLFQSWIALWTGTRGLQSIQEDLSSIADDLWLADIKIQKGVGVPQAEPGRRKIVAEGLDLARRLEVMHEIPRPVISDEEFAKALRARSRFAEGFIAVLSFLIALYTGMQVNYFDQAFGTLRDYIEIITWAIGAQVFSDLLLRSLDRLWTGLKAKRSEAVPVGKAQA